MSNICGFRDEYFFLSNFYPLKQPITERYKGKLISYPTVEHAFQASKVTSAAMRIIVSNCPTPGDAKRMGRTVKLRGDWEYVKKDIMKMWVVEKFRCPTLRKLLLDTKGVKLIEANNHRDTYWGTDRHLNGTNHLGKIIMSIRDEILENEIIFS